jgi:hypothetical protein
MAETDGSPSTVSLLGAMGPADDPPMNGRCTCTPLMNTASAQAEIGGACRTHILVDEAHVPFRRI